jgi:quinol-cytochrome oxidoreductase complex cytochrome b subunit
MNIKWNEWDVAEKTIFVSSCIAVVSIIMPWADIGIATKNGFSTGGFLLLGCFAYPLLKVLKEEKIDNRIGMLSSVLAIVLSIWGALSSTIEFMGKTVNTSGSGLILFIIASFILAFGTYKIQKTENSN